jgi:putative copper resistance protein D
MLASGGDTAVRALHLIGAAVWAGGLVFLGVAVGAARRTLPEEVRVDFFRTLGRRFLLVGGIALLVVIATGSDMARDRNAWDQLGDTSYGKTLLAKLILVGFVIALTVIHSAVQGPALSRLRAKAVERPDDEFVRAQIRRRAALAGVVSALMLLATIAILVLAARLVTL